MIKETLEKLRKEEEMQKKRERVRELQQRAEGKRKEEAMRKKNEKRTRLERQKMQDLSPLY